ncbi:Fc.00g083740.m01.CDS01 [Cosmosporella sp. VM-42]
MARVDAASDDRELFFLSLNDDKPTTIILLHGLLNSHLEWNFVIPHLQDYHLLVPDISGHSGSYDILPADLSVSTDRVAAIIRRHAKNGKAHVVGLSMGAFLTLRLSLRYPELVMSAFATAGHPMERQWGWIVGHPSFTYYVTLFLLNCVPPWLYFKVASSSGVLEHPDLLREMKRNRRWEVIQAVDRGLMELTWDDVRAIPVRTLSIAAGKVDDVEAVRRMGREMPVEGSLGVVIRGAVHTWNLQKPELFAEGIRAWVEGKPLPEGFEVLK